MSQQSIIAAMSIPSIAVSFNGNYLETVVPGYRTESVSGRGTTMYNITEQESVSINGAIYRSRRLKTNDTRVKFGLAADSLENLRQLEDRIKMYAMEENEQISFKDEGNTYRIGNVTEISFEDADTSGDDFVFETGEMIIHFSDPIRYDVAESQLTPDSNNTITIVYSGSIPVFPVIEVTATGGLDGFAVVSGTGAVLQIGNMEDTMEDSSSFKFAAGDVIKVYCDSARITVNNIDRPDLGAHGNTWSDFKIQNGTNSFKFTIQKTSSKPSIKLLYRKTYK